MLVNNIHEYVSTALVVVKDDLRISYLNPAAESLFSTSRRKAAKMPLFNLAEGLDLMQEALAQGLSQDAPFTERERRLVVAGDHLVTVDVTFTPLPGKRVLLEFNQLDRHLRISREHNLISQNRAMREVMRGLAHEIKNPLGGLRGAAQLLERELDKDELKEYTSVIIGEADRLQVLVDSMLGPNAKPEKKHINIHRVLERVRQLVQAEAPKGVLIERDYDPSIPDLELEPNQMIQAVLNLVRNALEAVGDKGVITLRTRTNRQFTIDKVTHRLVIRIDIIDDGPGIPLEMQEQIFLPMVTTRANGTGLGLSIAQTLVNQHGGLIEFTSKPGQTVFTIWLPLEE